WKTRFFSSTGLTSIYRKRSMDLNSFDHQSCAKLIKSGVNPDDIFVLISSRHSLLKPLVEAFRDANIDIEPPTGDGYIGTKPGRYVFAILRVACDIALQDYVAHRLVFGLPKGIGAKTHIGVRNKIETGPFRFLELLYCYDEPPSVFSTGERKAIQRAKKVFDELRDWSEDDTLGDRCDAIARLVSDAFDNETIEHRQEWKQLASSLPREITLKELRDYLGARNKKHEEQVLDEVYQRLGINQPNNGTKQSKVQIMTMHGAKGLNARVVFIPGLEAEILPGHKRRLYPGLVLEAARLLYVSITRASAACILSYATSRTGGYPKEDRSPSSFLTQVCETGSFENETDVLSNSEISRIIEAIDALPQD
ncbi:MAG: ATP-dependent helicase, partial [Anaerolineae bacterium]|nr:ATP-dependent helicase [Anaerolineae bacterium]